jgi:hypothetical protein
MLLTVEQVSADVVITGSGSIDTSGFSEYGTRNETTMNLAR